MSLSALLFSSKVYAHATLMLESRLIKEVPYDEKLRSGSDYNLALRLARTGVKLEHTGHFHLVRRLHGHQVTTTDAGVQKNSARVSSSLALRSLRPGKQKELREAMRVLPTVEIPGADTPAALIAPYLPDHLVVRTLIIEPQSIDATPGSLTTDPSFYHYKVVDNLTGTYSHGLAELRDARWEDMAMPRRAGVEYAIAGVHGVGQTETPGHRTATYLDKVSDHISRILQDSDHASFLVVMGPREKLPRLAGRLVADISLSHQGGKLDAHAYCMEPGHDLRHLSFPELESGAVTAKYFQKLDALGASTVWSFLEAGQE